MGENEDKPKTLREEILDKFSALITAAFGLVAALAWNEAIKAIFKEVFGTAESTVPLIIYASTVTIIAVILTFIIAKGISKAKRE
ncbi:MAG: DUF5654 family protein [Nitrosopumilaceae archaeon]